MTPRKSSWPSQAVKQLIPINQLITLPEGIPIPFDHLQIADLSVLPRAFTLVTFLGPSIKVLITRATRLRLTVICKVSGDDPFAQKYGIENIIRTMSYVAGTVPVDQAEAQLLPSLTSAGWKLPDEVTWQFELPVATTGAELLEAVKGSDEYIQESTVNLLGERVSS